MKLIVLICLSLLSVTAMAMQQQYPFEHAQQRQLFEELVHQLRCPKCQNQDIADSHALVAKDLKNKVYAMVKAGQSKAQIVAYMKQRYGDFVYYQPPFNPSTLILWLLPALVVLIGFIVVLRRAAASRAVILSPQQRAEINKLLDEQDD